MTSHATLFGLVAPRDHLRASFQHAWQHLPMSDPAALDDWADAAVELLETNAGAACQLAFWSASASASAGAGAGGSLRALAVSGRAAAEICRHAGARAALSCLQALPVALIVTQGGGIQRWWSGLQRLAREAAECVSLVAPHTQTLLADSTGAVFSEFVAVGLKAHARDRRQRCAFFSLQDPWARALLERPVGDGPGFEALSRRLRCFAQALWGDVATLRAGPANQPIRLSDRLVILPAAAITSSAPDTFYLAAVAHACAHLACPPVRYDTGSLKPLQIALVTLIEDARIEALAIDRLPGLRALWAPFHTASPADVPTAANRMARLARGLFDPAYDDPDGVVAKARLLFEQAAAEGLHDPALSLRLGKALAHDLGQMRVQFRWQEHVVAPVYRDDGSHLWESTAATIHASPIAAGPDTTLGPVIGRYPEWDGACGVERPDWTTLREAPSVAGNPGPLRAAMAAEPALCRRLEALLRGAKTGRPSRLRRQTDGDDLDLDAALDGIVALRAGQAPDARWFRRTLQNSGDMATIMLLDMSASAAARVSPQHSVLDLQRLAVALLAEALEANGDAFALYAFASDGRHDVRLSGIKTFAERFDDAALESLAGLRPHLSTRLGTVLRHARQGFAGLRPWRRLLLVLTDGEPADIDVADNRDLVTDARRAVLALRQSGIDVFGVALDPRGAGCATAIFGRANTVTMRELAELPARLAGLYVRLRYR